MEIFRTLVASYLIATLGATALAKLKNRRITSVGIQREQVIAARVAPAVTVILIVAEFLLATLLMLGVKPTATAFAAAALFAVFAGYRLIVAAKTKTLTCSCAGMIRTHPASLPSVAGASLACLILAGLACMLVFLGPPAGYPLNLLVIAAWLAPLVSLVKGARYGRKTSNADLFPAEFLPLWTAEMSTKRL